MTDQFIENTLSASAKEPVLALIKVEFENDTQYYVKNNESIVSSVDGSEQTYQPVQFSIVLPEQTIEGSPSATLSFDPTDINIVRKLREVDERVIVTLWLVLADDPSVEEFGPVQYESTDFTISSGAVELRMEIDPILDVVLPGKRFTPQTAPGLWK